MKIFTKVLNRMKNNKEVPCEIKEKINEYNKNQFFIADLLRQIGVKCLNDGYYNQARMFLGNSFIKMVVRPDVEDSYKYSLAKLTLKSIDQILSKGKKIADIENVRNFKRELDTYISKVAKVNKKYLKVIEEVENYPNLYLYRQLLWFDQNSIEILKDIGDSYFAIKNYDEAKRFYITVHQELNNFPNTAGIPVNFRREILEGLSIMNSDVSSQLNKIDAVNNEAAQISNIPTKVGVDNLKNGDLVVYSYAVKEILESWGNVRYFLTEIIGINRLAPLSNFDINEYIPSWYNNFSLTYLYYFCFDYSYNQLFDGKYKVFVLKSSIIFYIKNNFNYVMDHFFPYLNSKADMSFSCVIKSSVNSFSYKLEYDYQMGTLGAKKDITSATMLFSNVKLISDVVGCSGFANHKKYDYWGAELVNSIPYLLDSVVFLGAMSFFWLKNIEYGLSSESVPTKMLYIKEASFVISATVMTDYVTKMAISLVENSVNYVGEFLNITES